MLLFMAGQRSEDVHELDSMPGPERPMRKFRDGRCRLRPRARAEDGFMLVELLVASLLVALVSVGLYTAAVGSSRGSANDRHRSIAAALAQQDQERMRAFKATDLSNYRASRSVPVAGTTYTVDSRGQWVSDSSGLLSCSSGSSTANYLHITSSVTWPSMGSLKPVVIRSLVAPPNGSLAANKGSLAVKVTDQANNPISGQSLNLGSPANISDTTDSSGCAVFGGITAGNYQLTYSQAGYVDVGGNNSVNRTVSVTAGTTTTQNELYAQAGSIDVGFDTKVGSNPAQATTSDTVTVAHSNLPAPGRRTFDPPGGAVNTISATSLFPFTSSYNVYAGSCAANDPSSYNSNYYSSNPGAVTVAPGGSYAVTVREPAIRIRTLLNGSGYEGAHVVVKLTSSGCSGTWESDSNSSFALPDPGFPFGTYQVCADARVPWFGSFYITRRTTVSNIANTNPNGTSVIDLNVTSSSSSGACT
jgi:type II secretory pathway pseudopilin PulG